MVKLLSQDTALQAIRPIANQGKLETVGRLCRSLNEFMTFAVNTCVIEHNRLADIGKAFFTVKVTNQASLDA